MANLNIETSQHVQIDYAPAGVGPRVGAFFIDLLIMIAYLVFMSIVIFSGMKMTWLFVVAQLPILFYHLLFELFFNGQSPGKMALQIRVMNKDGTPATLGQFLLRWVFWLVDIMLTSGALAFFTVLINGEGQRLGDIAAGTTVVKTNQETTLDDTLFADVEDDYTPVYPNVSRLTDEDISVIKEVLNEGQHYDSEIYLTMLAKTRDTIARKLNAEIKESYSRDFLDTVIKDYNVVHG